MCDVNFKQISPASKLMFHQTRSLHSTCSHQIIAVNMNLKDQMTLLKAPCPVSREIYSSSGCTCQISLAVTLTTAESSSSDVCVRSGVNDHYIALLCSGRKTMPPVHKKQIRRNRFHSLSLFSSVFVKQEERLINTAAWCSCSCNTVGNVSLKNWTYGMAPNLHIIIKV